MSRPTFWYLLVVILAGLLLARESRQPSGTLAGVDRAFFDWLGVNAPPIGEAADAARRAPAVTLVGIDEAVLQTPGRWPLAPLEYAAFLEAVDRFDPAAVGIVPPLEWPESGAGTEGILADQALRVPRLLLGLELGSDFAQAHDTTSLTAIGETRGSRSALAEFPEIVAAPDARLRPLVAATGATNLPPAADGPVRDIPLLFRSRGRVVPSFTLAALMLALRLAPAEIEAAPGGEVRFGDRLRLPVDRAGRALLDPRAYSHVNHLTLDDLPLLAAGTAPPEVRAAAERMRGGVVLLGRTDPGARQLRLTNGTAVAPADVFAWAVESLQMEPPIRRASLIWDGVVIVVFAALGLAGARGGRGSVFPLAVGALTLYLLVALAVFEAQRLWLPVALPIGLSVINLFLPALLPRSRS